MMQELLLMIRILVAEMWLMLIVLLSKFQKMKGLS